MQDGTTAIGIAFSLRPIPVVWSWNGWFPQVLGGALLSLTGLCSDLKAEPPSVEASVFLGTYREPPASMALSSAAQKRAKALSLYYKGRRLQREVDDDLALAAYRDALALEPANFSLVERMASLLAESDKPNDALAVLEKSLQDNPQNARAYLALSRHCLRHHHNADELKAKAISYGNQALEKFPGEAAVYRHLLGVYFQLGAKESDGGRQKSRELMERALQVPSEDPHFWLELALVARNAYPLDDKEKLEANLQAILAFADRALTKAGEDLEVAERVADLYAQYAGQKKLVTLYHKALPLYQKIATAQPSNLSARQKLARTLRLSGKLEQSAAMYEDLVRINPQDLESHRVLVKICEERKDGEGAIRHRMEILRWEGGSPRDWGNLAADLLEAKKVEEAINVLKRARATHTESAPLAYQMALSLKYLQRTEESLAKFAETKDLAEKFNDAKEHKENADLLKNHDFYYSWASAAHAAKKAELAADLYRKSIDLAPKDHPEEAAKSYNDLGYLWLELDEKIDEAGELIHVANQMVKDHPGYIDSLGWFHFKKKNYAEARKELERAVSLLQEPDSEVLDHLGQALWHLGQKPEAVAALEKAAGLPEADGAVKKRLEEYRAGQPPQP